MEKYSTRMDREVDKIETLWDRAKGAATEALTWGKKISKVGNLKLTQAKLQRLRSNTTQELGDRVYTLLKEGRFSPIELQELVQQLDEINHKLEILQKEIDIATQQESSLFPTS